MAEDIFGTVTDVNVNVSKQELTTTAELLCRVVVMLTNMQMKDGHAIHEPLGYIESKLGMAHKITARHKGD
jgi:hypothetical protein